MIQNIQYMLVFRDKRTGDIINIDAKITHHKDGTFSVHGLKFPRPIVDGYDWPTVVVN